MEWALFLKQFAGLLAVLNPIGAVPIFVSLTEGRLPAERNAIARTASTTVVAVLLVSLLAGDLFLQVFGITIASFRVGGGILLLFMAIAMLHARRSGAKQSREESEEAMSRHAIATVPLGIPLLAGPGSISTVILYRHTTEHWIAFLGLAGIIGLMGVLIYLILRFSAPMAQRFGRTGINIIMRVMGLVLAAIAVEFIADGLYGLFPILGRP